MLRRLRDSMESCNLNFLIGSGASSPYLRTLGSIELHLASVEASLLPANGKKILECSLYKEFFEGVMWRNCLLLEGDPAAEPILKAYTELVKGLSSLLRSRKSTILGKEVNIFTTNIDVFLEKAIDRVGVECNDGFSGRFEPVFALSNFKKSHFKRSLQYDNVSELPTINLLKLHGSLTWQSVGNDKIVFSPNLEAVRNIREVQVTDEMLIALDDEPNFETLAERCGGKVPDDSVRQFLGAYDELLIVNPNKAKFKHTLLNQTYYELLRIYSNELEKENTLLFVIGFSFADEHIREITLRAANSNPTLLINVLAYDTSSRNQIQARFPAANIRNNNIEVIGPETDPQGNDAYRYDLSTINKRLLSGLLGPSASANQDPAAAPLGQ